MDMVVKVSVLTLRKSVHVFCLPTVQERIVGKRLLMQIKQDEKLNADFLGAECITIQPMLGVIAFGVARWRARLVCPVLVILAIIMKIVVIDIISLPMNVQWMNTTMKLVEIVQVARRVALHVVAWLWGMVTW